MAAKRRVRVRAGRSRGRAGPPAGGERERDRPNLATVNPEARLGRGSFAVGSRVRILGDGLYAGEAGTVEAAASGIIPSALVRTDAGHLRRVRTIDLEAVGPTA